jgi:hypothetical protein
MKRRTRDKRSSLVRQFVNCKENEVMLIWPQVSLLSHEVSHGSEKKVFNKKIGTIRKKTFFEASMMGLGPVL